MIRLAQGIDLGLDKVRMGADDAARQTTTVRELLRRFSDEDQPRRVEAQLLADEVGMGKTMVALAVALSVLQASRADRSAAGLRGTNGQVLILTPPNEGLFHKWLTEVQEFVRRCVEPGYRDAAEKSLSVAVASNLEQLVSHARTPKVGVVLAKVSAMGLGRGAQAHMRRRNLLLAVFRATRFGLEARERLLLGAPDAWPSESELLAEIGPGGDVLDEEVLVNAVRCVGSADPLLRDAHAAATEIAALYMRDRSARFGTLLDLLDKLYVRIVPELLDRPWPMVVVDEAHGWKGHANRYRHFVDRIAPISRRLLMLTATPFQLRPEEILNLLEAGEHLGGATDQETASRRAWLRQQREQILRPALNSANVASQMFTDSWAELPADAGKELSPMWAELTPARAGLDRFADPAKADATAGPAIAGVDPALRSFAEAALKLYVANRTLSRCLGRFVIRHRRPVGHRLVLVGREFVDQLMHPHGSASSVLHRAPGIPITGDAELPFWLLMRCVADMERGQRPSGLGEAITGCWSTLFNGRDGDRVRKACEGSPDTAARFALLEQLVSKDGDGRHPKVSAVVDRTMAAWERGEKTLIFCFRKNNVARLSELIGKAIKDRLDERREALGLSDARLVSLRGRLTAREGDLSPLLADRVLWSWWWHRKATERMAPWPAGALRMTRSDMQALAELSLRFDRRLDEDRVDRVFLMRATETVIARRLQRIPHLDEDTRTLLQRMAETKWIAWPYGVATTHAVSEQTDGHDPGGAASIYHELAAGLGHGGRRPELSAGEIARRLEERRLRARQRREMAIVDAYAEGANMWLGPGPPPNAPRAVAGALHRALWNLGPDLSDQFFVERLEVIQALRRVVGWEDVLFQILPGREELEGEG